MSVQAKHWLGGLIRAVCNSILGSFAVAFEDPQKFRVGPEASHHLLHTMLWIGGLSFLVYLSKAPLPALDDAPEP